MKPRSNAPSSPLSFSVLDIVFALVGINLIAAFALAAQPNRDSEVRINSRYISVSVDAAEEDDQQQGIGIAVFYNNAWRDLNNLNGGRYVAAGLGVAVTSNTIYVSEDIADDDKILIYVSQPATSPPGSASPPKFDLSIVCAANGAQNRKLKKADITVFSEKVTTLCGW